MIYRRARHTDIPVMAEIRAADWGTVEYWRDRFLQYLAHELRPKESLAARVSFVCVDRERVVVLIAGHLTRRFSCNGELQWISVLPQYRGRGVAGELLRRLAKWFARHDALRVCVDVDPANEVARHFYARHGAEDLKPPWMVWKDIRWAAQDRPGLRGARARAKQ